MIHGSIKEILNYNIITKDGEIVKVHNYYFTIDPWVIRYIMVNTGGWIKKNIFLIPLAFVLEINKQKKEISIDVTLKQIKESPKIGEHKPILRQKEIEVSNYYNIDHYWIGESTWGKILFPKDLRKTKTYFSNTDYTNTDDCFLKDIKNILTYHARVGEGESRHIKDIIINKHTWAIEYIVLNTHDFSPRKFIIASIGWIKEINWSQNKIYLESFEKVFVKNMKNKIFFPNN